MKETLQKRSSQLGQVYQSGTCQLQDYTQLSYCRITIFPSLQQGP